MAALKRDELKCTGCRQGDRVLQVHHTLYRKRWEDTQLHDLKTLCVPCHQRVHAPKLQRPQPKIRTAQWYQKQDKRIRAFLKKKRKAKRQRQVWLSRKSRYGWSF